MELRSISDHKEQKRSSSASMHSLGSRFNNPYYGASSVSYSSRSRNETDLDLNLQNVLKAARITDIALLPKYLTHDSYAVRQMAEMRYIRITASA